MLGRAVRFFDEPRGSASGDGLGCLAPSFQGKTMDDKSDTGGMAFRPDNLPYTAFAAKTGTLSMLTSHVQTKEEVKSQIHPCPIIANSRTTTVS
jgi:hypothetical protein